MAGRKYANAKNRARIGANNAMSSTVDHIDGLSPTPRGLALKGAMGIQNTVWPRAGRVARHTRKARKIIEGRK